MRRLLGLLSIGLAVAAYLTVFDGSAAGAARCHLAGAWSQTTEGLGSSTWKIAENGKAQESGLAGATGTAELLGDVLKIESKPPDSSFDGTYRWELKDDCSGTGTLTFTNPPRAGEEHKSEVHGPAPTEDKKPDVVKAAAWGRPKESGPVATGGGTLVESPPLAKRQRAAKIKIQSQNVPDFEAILAPLSKRGRLLACVAMYEEFREREVEATIDINLGPGRHLRNQKIKYRRGNDVVAVYGAAACMSALARLTEREKSAAGAAAARMNGCSAVSFAMQFKRPTAKRAGSAQVIGDAKHRQSGPLVTSCRFGRGGVTLEVRPRARRATLRSIVGPRLVVGVHRTNHGPEPGRVRTTFTRP